MDGRQQHALGIVQLRGVFFLSDMHVFDFLPLLTSSGPPADPLLQHEGGRGPQADLLQLEPPLGGEGRPRRPEEVERRSGEQVTNQKEECHFFFSYLVLLL